ncbi:hypothetical protein SVIOM342S_01277 [Streptomyces violaceorubidus]
MQGLAGLGVQAVQPLGRAREGVRRAQDAGALRHDPLDREAGLGREEGVLRVLGVRKGGRYARVDRPGRDVGRDAFGVDQALQEGVGRQAVGAVHPRAGDLAAGVQAGDRRTAVGVGAHAARGVVGGRGHGDRLGDRVDAVGAAGGEDRGEALLPHRPAEVAGVQVHVVGVALLHAAGDGLRDDVPWGEFRQFVLSQHEAHAVRVHQVGALAAHRLGDQGLLALGVRAEEEDGGVELDEFEVADLGTRAQGEGHAVARGDGGVRRRREHLAHAAGGEDDRGGVDRSDAVVLALAHDVQGDAGGAAVGVREEVEHEGVLDRAQPARAYRLHQGAGDLGARRVAARVGDAAAVVAALAGEGQAALGGLVEVRAGRDEPAYGVGALGGQDADRFRVAQAGAGHQGVVQVLLGGVALAEGRGDAALRPPGGAVVQAGLGDDDGPQTGGLAAQGSGEAATRSRRPPRRRRWPSRARGVQSYACAGHEAAPRGPKVRWTLSIRRVAPTRAATARTASPVWSSPISVKSAGSTRAR